MALKLESKDSVLIATINRPARKNAVDQETLAELANALKQAEAQSIRVIVLTGAENTFCSGADLSGVREVEFTDALHKLLVQLATSPCVTIAAIDGHALGAGAQLAISCDLRVAAARLGLVVNHWTVERLTRECSWPVARAMLLAARNYSGEELAQLGAVHRIGDLDVALGWAHEIAALAPLSIAGHKAALNASSRESEIDEIVRWTRDFAWASKDVEEGRAAFLEKRAAKFKGE
jgi:enoyl-CoA hydratase